MGGGEIIYTASPVDSRFFKHGAQPRQGKSHYIIITTIYAFNEARPQPLNGV